MPATQSKTIAIVGATGVVGRTIETVLEERGFAVDNYVPVATGRRGQKETTAFGKTWTLTAPDDVDFSGIDVAFFSAGASVSEMLVPKAVDRGCRVVDNTTAFRMDRNVPLVVPEINATRVGGDAMLVACPNCTAIVLVMSLAPLLAAVPVERVVMTSFQSVSGAGREALCELDEQIEADAGDKAPQVEVLPRQIAFNCVPVIGDALESGYTKEEEKIVEESQKILDEPELKIVPTAVRVPTRVGHAIAVNVELKEPLAPGRAIELWKSAPGVTYSDEVPTPLDAAGSDMVIAGRVRRDPTRPNAITYWVVGDNLRKGAATNSVQIAELFL
ncbi:MAG: aspartate-semialdehyde dehydrogenase [Candidatus Latescibacterota bacterium]|nr:MAG: aspartate-semialdehyde dehydrogenase [Candidatus Latescibacterota bacterium]